MRKIIALLIAALMVLSTFAGCGKTTSGGETTNAPASGDSDTVTPVAAGTLTINAVAAATITYNKDGLVLEVKGINESGSELAETYEDQLGSSCADFVSQFIKDSIVKNYMFESNFVVIKQNKGSALSGTDFLEGVKTAAQAVLDTVGSSAALVVVGEENLDPDGYIDLATAKVLVEKHLKVDDVDSFDGTDKPVAGMYAFNVVIDKTEENVLVDAETGSVSQGVLNDAEQLPEDYPDETVPEDDIVDGPNTDDSTTDTDSEDMI